MSTPEALQLVQRAVAALQRRDWVEAGALAEAVLQRFGPEANALMVLAAVRNQAGDLPAAIALYERARELMPAHVHVLVNLAAAYRASGRLAQARAALEAAVRAAPSLASAHNNLGNVLLDLGERAPARAAYARASELDARYAEPLAALARMAEEEHRLNEARGLAERALERAPQNTLAVLTLARVRLRADEPEAARSALEPLRNDRSLSATNRVVVLSSLGEAYDKLARYPEAFAAFAEANELQHALYASSYEHADGPLTAPGVARLTRFLSGADPASWRAGPPAERLPVFMIGFPRSGTTLLDQVLASHPAVTTLEEGDTLRDVAAQALTPEGLAHWAALSDAQLAHWRGLYWQRVTQALHGPPQRGVFIDKQPLNAALLPLIWRLFPQAQVILSLRDPRDVLLSCYQQRFGMNAPMYQLLRLDSAAHFYDAVMGLVELSRSRLPLRLHLLRYEDLIGQFEPCVRALLTFLQLPWDEQVREYAQTARQRNIGTPSAAQVVRPLYRSALGRWRNYEALLQPQLPLLQPWLEKFGYPP